MQAPVYTRQVQDGGPETIRRAPNDQKNFAALSRAAEIEESGAQKIAHGGQLLAAGIDKAAIDADNAKVNAAVSEYMEKSTDMLYNPDSGIMNTTGGAAEGLYDKAKETHKKLYDDISGKLKGRQRTMFTENISNYDRGISQTVMSHEGKSMSEYRKTEAIKVLDTTAIAWSKNPDALPIEAQEDAIRAGAIGIYGADATEKQVDDLRSKLIGATAMRIAGEDPLKAEGFLKQYSGNMSPVDAEDMRIKLEKIAEPVKAQVVADEMLKEFGVDNRDAALDKVRQMYSGEEENAYLRATEGLFVDKETARNNALTKSYNATLDMIIDGGSLQTINNAINAADWASNISMKKQLLDARDQKFKLGNWSEGGSGEGRVKTDQSVLRNLWLKANDGTLAKDAPDYTTFYKLYGRSLSTYDLRPFYSMYHSGSKEASDPAMKMQYAGIFMDKMKAAGVADTSQQAAYVDRYNYEMEKAEIEAAKAGKFVSAKNRVDIMALVLGPVIVGQKRNFMGRKVDRTVRGGDIPPGSELRGKTWYYPDETSPSGFSPLIFKD